MPGVDASAVPAPEKFPHGSGFWAVALAFLIVIKNRPVGSPASQQVIASAVTGPTPSSRAARTLAPARCRARAAAPTAGTSSRPERPRTWRGPRAARPRRGWPSTWAYRKPASLRSCRTARSDGRPAIGAEFQKPQIRAFPPARAAGGRRNPTNKMKPFHHVGSEAGVEDVREYATRIGFPGTGTVVRQAGSRFVR
jgi:hypothetical protein